MFYFLALKKKLMLREKLNFRQKNSYFKALVMKQRIQPVDKLTKKIL